MPSAFSIHNFTSHKITISRTFLSPSIPHSTFASLLHIEIPIIQLCLTLFIIRLSTSAISPFSFPQASYTPRKMPSNTTRSAEPIQSQALTTPNPCSKTSNSPTPNPPMPSPKRRRRTRASRQKKIKTSWEFREFLLAKTPAANKKIPLTTRDGREMLLVPIAMDGNCGFHAIAMGLKEAGIIGASEATSREVRQRLMAHVSEDTAFYAEKIADWCQVLKPECTQDEAWDMGLTCVQKFLEAVVKEGLNGHWLGGLWGQLELMAVSRAYGVHVEVFTFCTLKHDVTKYEEHNVDAQETLSLFYAGSAKGGHFDLLLSDNRTLNRIGRWSKRVGGKMVAKWKPVANLVAKAFTKLRF